METYDETVENFQAYIEKLEQYLELNRIHDTKKVSAWRKNVWAVEKFNSTREIKKSFDELVRLLQNHILPKTIIMPKHFGFISEASRKARM